MIRQFLFTFCLIISSFGYSQNLDWQYRTSTKTVIDEILKQQPNIPRKALETALAFYRSNPRLVQNKRVLSIVNFDQPSTDERLFVIDMKLLLVQSYLVAHGKASGENYATFFSNEPESNMSSLGIYLTDIEYIGQHGISLILKGQDITNSNAEARAIVMHAADYVSQDFIAKYGRLGRSLGCLALNPAISIDLTHQLAGGSVIYAYHSGVVSNIIGLAP